MPRRPKVTVDLEPGLMTSESLGSLENLAPTPVVETVAGEEPKKRGRKKKEEIIPEPTPEFKPEDLTALVMIPANIILGRLNLTELNEHEGIQIASALAPVMNKYGGAIVNWMPELTLVGVVGMVGMSRFDEFQRNKKEAEKAKKVQDDWLKEKVRLENENKVDSSPIPSMIVP